MLKNRAFVTLIISALAIIASGVTAISCTSNEDVSGINDPIAEETVMGNDTIYVETEAPLIEKATISSVSDKTLNLINTLRAFSTRSTSNDEVFFLYDEWTDKCAYAVENPSQENSWIFECYKTTTEDPIIIIFEQVSSNEFITKDENGNILRYFFYDPEKRELTTYNDPATRGKSMQDKILCNSMFTMLSYLVCEGLAVPTGGASLLVGLGFAVASTYVC